MRLGIQAYIDIHDLPDHGYRMMGMQDLRLSEAGFTFDPEF